MFMDPKSQLQKYSINLGDAVSGDEYIKRIWSMYTMRRYLAIKRVLTLGMTQKNK